jgi:hypothetical protein
MTESSELEVADKVKAAPAKRGRPKKAPAAGETVVVPLKTVTLKGRTIEVRRPTDEQLFAWDHILRRMEAIGSNIQNLEQARKLIAKCETIINSVIVNEADRDWIEDGRLGGTITLHDAGSIVIDALKMYQPEEKPAARPRTVRRAKV